MRCEARLIDGRYCQRRAFRPVIDDMGFNSWCCRQHGGNKKTWHLWKDDYCKRNGRWEKRGKQ